MSRQKYCGARQLPETKRAQGRGFIEEGRGWAFARRHDDGVSSIWPSEYRSHLRYTPIVCHRHRGSTYLQKERERKNCQSLLQKKKLTTREISATRFDIRARLNPLSPERPICQLLNGGDKRISLYLVYRVDMPIIIKMLRQTFQLLFTFVIEI